MDGVKLMDSALGFLYGMRDEPGLEANNCPSLLRVSCKL